MSESVVVALEPPAPIYPGTSSGTVASNATTEGPDGPLLRPLSVVEAVNVETPANPKGPRTLAVNVAITCTTAISTLLSGLLTVCIPVISRELAIPDSLQLWPASVFALTCGCTLLLSGSAADVAGCRRLYLLGTLLQSVFTLGCGLATSTAQMIVFRGLAGIASSFCLPSAVSIVTRTFPPGQSRNFAFAAMGGGQPVGFGLGLILGGVFSDTVGWRWGFHMATLLNTSVLALAVWALPAHIDPPLAAEMWSKLATDIDWLGATLIGTCLALISYVFVAVTNSGLSIREPSNITLLIVAVALVPAFVFWMRRQTSLGQPALIPNSLWKNVPFTTMCITVFVVWGGFNAVEQLIAFYFEFVLQIPALKSSVYLAPVAVSGAIMNILVGFLLPYVRASIAVPAACVAATISPLILALVSQLDDINYWRGTFEALILNPVAPDIIYTIANLVVTSAFPQETQGIAGGVFNTVSQFGKSVGLATAAVIAGRITSEARDSLGLGDLDETGPIARQTLLQGYQAGWWYCSALQLLAVAISIWGLRRIGKVGVKEE